MRLMLPFVFGSVLFCAGPAGLGPDLTPTVPSGLVETLKTIVREFYTEPLGLQEVELRLRSDPFPLDSRSIRLAVEVSAGKPPTSLRVGVTVRDGQVLSIGADGPALSLAANLDDGGVAAARERTLDSLRKIMGLRDIVTERSRAGGELLFFLEEHGKLDTRNVIVLRESDGLLIVAGAP